MMYFIIGFIIGAFFGVGWMCLLSAGKQADETMLNDFGTNCPEVGKEDFLNGKQQKP